MMVIESTYNEWKHTSKASSLKENLKEVWASTSWTSSLRLLDVDAAFEEENSLPRQE